MKAISNIILLSMAACGLALAQGTAKSTSGFVRIVNAVAEGSGKAGFSINGRDLFAGGYALGKTTGQYGVKAGDLTITVRKTGVETGRANIQLKADETITLIAFGELVPQTELSAPPKWGVKFLRLRQMEEANGLTLSLISMCKAEEIPLDLFFPGNEKKEKVYAKRLAVTKVDLNGKRDEFFIKAGDQALTTVMPEGTGNYVVILYENAEGKMEAVSCYDEKFLVTD